MDVHDKEQEEFIAEMITVYRFGKTSGVWEWVGSQSKPADAATGTSGHSAVMNCGACMGSGYTSCSGRRP